MSQFPIPQLRTPEPSSIELPGSKSIALRQLAISALVEGTSHLSGMPPCDDIDAMLDCLERLGVGVEQTRRNNRLDLRIQGPMDRLADVHLDARMSGASTRLLIGLAALRKGTTTIDGHPSLRVRTNQPLFDTLIANGCSVVSADGGLPATIQGPLVPPPVLSVDGSISSQYITALLIASPLMLEMSSREQQIIQITGQLVSKPYLDITLAEMSKRGAKVAWQGADQICVKRQGYNSADLHIEGDATAASYFLALATVHHSTVTLTNLSDNTHQGDFAFTRVMQELGAKVMCHAGTTTITGPAQLRALAPQDMTSMPDAALTLIAMAPLIPEATEITGLSTLHHKECDRLLCSTEALQAMGIAAQATESTVTIPYCPPAMHKPHLLNTHHDHRMAMAFSVLASVSGKIIVDDKMVVAKTYPHYWDDYLNLRPTHAA